MPTLTLSWLRSGAAHIGDNRIQFRTRQAGALRIYVTTEAVLSDTLIGLLWPDYPETSAHQSLRTNLSHLRRVLDGMVDKEPPFLTSDNQTVLVRLNATVTFDVAKFTV